MPQIMLFAMLKGFLKKEFLTEPDYVAKNFQKKLLMESPVRNFYQSDEQQSRAMQDMKDVINIRKIEYQ